MIYISQYDKINNCWHLIADSSTEFDYTVKTLKIDKSCISKIGKLHISKLTKQQRDNAINDMKARICSINCFENKKTELRR